MNITGKITGIKYKIFLSDTLKEINISDFNINESPSACLLTDKKIFACYFEMGFPKTHSFVSF